MRNCFSLNPGVAECLMSSWRLSARVSVTWRPRGAFELKGGWMQEQPQGLKFQTPGVVFVIWITLRGLTDWLGPGETFGGSVTDMASDKRRDCSSLNQCQLD